MTQRLFLLQPDTVFAARVNQASFEYPLAEVAYDTVTTGAFGDIQAGMTVLFGTSAGSDDLGRQRVRKAATSDTLYIGRSSRGTRDGEVDLQDDAHITVLNDYRVWAKMSRIADDGTVYKDHDLAVGTRTTDIPPKANIQPGFADTIDGSDIITVDFDAAGSVAVDPGASISSYSWDVDDGTITVGTATDQAITATFPAGFRWVRLTVTDSNDNSHTAVCPVYARDPAADTTISAFQIEDHVIRKEGQELTLRILEDVDAGTYPDGTLVILWEGEPVNAADRSHMAFIGWHQTDPAESIADRTATLRDTRLECLDVAGRLNTLPGFPQSVQRAETADSWLKMVAPNMDLYLDYLLRWHSNALLLADMTLSGTGSDFPFVILGSDGATLWQQVASRAQALTPDYHLTCNTLGQMAVVVDPLLQDAADRTSTIQATLQEADWRDIRYSHQRPPRVHWHRRGAIVAHPTDINAVFCVAPGESPGQGEAEQEQDEKLTPDQATLNAAEGHRYARLNAEETHFSVMLAEGSDKDIEPADLTWVRLNVSAATAAQRGLTLSDERGLVHEVNISYDYRREGLTRTVELLWERETSGTPAVTYEPPGDDYTDPEYDPDDDWYEEDPGGGEGDGFGTLYVWSNDVLTRTRDFSASSPSWSDIGPAGATELYDFVLDPWAPTTTAYLVADTGVYKSTDMNLASPSWTLVLSKTDLETASGGTYSVVDRNDLGKKIVHIEACITVQDKVYFFWPSTTPDAQYCSSTTDGGSSWSHTKIIDNVWGMGAVDQHGSSDIAYCLIGAQTGQVQKTTDGNSSWSKASDVGTDVPEMIIVPYPNNPNGDRLYVGNQTTNDAVYISEDGGATWSQFKPSGLDPGDIGAGSTDALDPPRFHRWGLEENPDDGDKGFVFARGGNLYTTIDNFASVVQRNKNIIGSVLTVGVPLATGGFPFDAEQFYIVTGTNADDQCIFVSTDAGDTFEDKTGDWFTQFGSPSSQVFSGIVPLWVPE